MKLFLIVLFSVTTILSLPVSAEYYRYIDKNGNVSFTDNLENVPEDQRQNAEKGGNRPNRQENSKLSAKDLDLIRRLKEAGLIDEKAEGEITPE